MVAIRLDFETVTGVIGRMEWEVWVSCYEGMRWEVFTAIRPFKEVLDE
jgi:hypothetical protein